MQQQSDSCPMEPMAMIYTYIHIATVGNTIQTVNSPMYDTYMSTPGNTAKLGATHSNIRTAQRGPSLVGSELTMLNQHTTESTLYPLCQPGSKGLNRTYIIEKLSILE